MVGGYCPVGLSVGRYTRTESGGQSSRGQKGGMQSAFADKPGRGLEPDPYAVEEWAGVRVAVNSVQRPRQRSTATLPRSKSPGRTQSSTQVLR